MSTTVQAAAFPELRRILRYAVAYGSSSLVLKGFGFGVFLWVARTLPVGEYARFGVFYAIQAGVATFAVAGLSESVIGLLKENPSSASRRGVYAAANTLFALLGTVSVAAATALGLLALAPRPGGGNAAALLMVAIAGALTAFAALQGDFRRIEEEHGAALAFAFFLPLAGQVGGLVGVVVGISAASYFVGSALGMAAATALLRTRGVGFYALASRTNETRPLRRKLAPFFAITLVGWLSGYGNNLAVSWLFDAAAVARFTFAFTLAAIMQLVATSLNQVWSPRFYRLVREAPGADVERDNRGFFRLQAIVMGAIGAAALAAYPAMVSVIGGNAVAYRSLQTELLLLFGAYVLFSPWWQCQNYFLVHSQGGKMMSVVLKTSAVGIPLWIAAMAVFGPIGIYLGFLGNLVARMLGVVHVARQQWPVQVAWEGIAAGLLLLGIGYAVSIRLASGAA